jgi:hypothetical protein
MLMLNICDVRVNLTCGRKNWLICRDSEHTVFGDLLRHG